MQSQVRGQVQQGSGEGSGEGLGSFGAEPGHVQQGFGEGSREHVGSFGAESGQVHRGSVWEALVQGQVKFNRVPEKIPEKVWEALEHARCFQRFRKICENKTLRLLGIPPKLMCYLCINLCTYVCIFYSFTSTSSTAQGAGGSFKK